MSLLINVSSQGDETIVSINGEVDVSNANDLRAKLDEVLEGIDPESATNVTIDIAEVPYIDSTGIGVLVGTVQRASKRGLALALKNPQRNVARVLGLLGLGGELGLGDETEE